jgi:hypothetical protein
MSEAISHMITFQSFEDVNTNREFRDQLLKKTINTHSIPDGLIHDALNASNGLDMALEPANGCAGLKFPYGCRTITTTCSYETTRAVKSCE